MTRVKTYIAIAAFSIMVLCLPAIASAQWSNDDDYNRGSNNGGYYGNGQSGNGQYGNGQYGNNGYGNTSATIRSLKSKARSFERQLDRDLDRSRINGTRREDQINDMAKRFRKAVDDLDNSDFNNNNRRGNRNDSRSDNDVRRVYDYAAQVERAIGRANISYGTRNLWSSIRNDLQVLSRGYGYNNGRGNTGTWGNGRNNNGRNGLPSWWPF